MSSAPTQPRVLSLRQLADALGLRYQGSDELPIRGVASLTSAGVGDLCFLQALKHRRALGTSRCSAVIVPCDFTPETGDGDHAWLFSDHPQRDFLRAIDCLGVDPPRPAAGIHPSAVVADSARIGRGVSIGPLVVIGEGVDIGDDSVIGAGCIIEEQVRVGRRCLLHPRVTLCHRTVIGDDCILHSGAVIGADGFGLVLDQGRWIKVPQLGRVVIGEQVEIGANTTIDRGALDDTVIEDGVKLDNQIQVAHNVRIGKNTAIAAGTAIAGSTRIGRDCRISGVVGIVGHIEIADGSTVTAQSLVTRSIREPGVWSSGTPLMENRQWLRANARYKQLDTLAERLQRLEEQGLHESDDKSNDNED